MDPGSRQITHPPPAHPRRGGARLEKKAGRIPCCSLASGRRDASEARLRGIVAVAPQALALNGLTLARILEGEIQWWNSSEITTLGQAFLEVRH